MFLLIPLFAFLFRAHGAVWNKLPFWPELLIAGALTSVAYTHSPYLAPIAFVVAFFGLRLGHGNFWLMEGCEDGELEEVEYVVRKLYKGDIHKPLYSWLCMGFKGLVIGLTAAPYGLLLAFLWPLAYYINFKLLDRPQSDWAEWIAGGFIGLILMVAWGV